MVVMEDARRVRFWICFGKLKRFLDSLDVRYEIELRIVIGVILEGWSCY